MQMLNVIHATGALRKFLDARAQGAPRELLTQLSAESLLEMEAELERERAAKPTRRSNLTDVVIDFNRARRGRGFRAVVVRGFSSTRRGSGNRAGMFILDAALFE